MLPFRLSARAVLVFAVFLTIAAVNAVSDTAPRNPKSKAAVDAKVKYDHAADAAEATYRKAILAAKRQYLQELNAAFKSALKAEKLDEAKLISDERQQLEIDIEFLKGGTATIAANQGWQKVLSVSKGEHLHLRAKGWWCLNVNAPQVTTGPDGFTKQHQFFPEGVLIGRIGSQEFEIGNAAETDVAEDGVLEARPRDGGIFDNSGAMQLVVIAHK